MNDNEQKLQDLRTGFSAFHAAKSLSASTKFEQIQKSIIAYSGNTFYEQIQKVAYNPDFQMLEAIIAVKRDYGYNGNLCTDGSFAFVRFYLDYGKGWEDQGYSAVNEHDIPTGVDCQKSPEKPLNYAASLKINPKTNICSVHVLPKARAILEWNKIPPANDPNYISVWGNTVDDFIQIKPYKLIIFENPVFSQLVELTLLHPTLKITDAAKLIPGGEAALQQSQSAITPAAPDLKTLADLYKGQTYVTPGRYGLHSALPVIQSYNEEIINQKVSQLQQNGIDLGAILSELEKTSADVSYEQLESIGLDYNLEQFVASFRIKRAAGYSGDLCSKGSLEYVAFWVDWGNNCKWEYAGTTTVNVHDINNIPKEGLSYAAILPYDFNKMRKLCANPEVVKIRAVLSWAVAPSVTDPDKLDYWGNRLDTYIQIKPGVGSGVLKPLFNILGGITVDKISDVNGLTIPGAKFALNQVAVNDYSPFGGIIVVQGPSFVGHQYRIKVTDMSTLASHYVNNDFTAVGWLPTPPYVQYTNVQADPVTFYYNYQTFDKNTDNVLARFSPGTNNLLRIDLEIAGVAGLFTKYIQMDNNSPAISLQINDAGDCSHYKVGDTITGSYSVYDAHLLSYSLVSSFGGSVNGTANTSANFSFGTAGVKTPCGKISLTAYEKTIYDSQWTGNYSYIEQIICLK
ncbi:hypothetical protein [Pedobacter cryoconitis]|uniref:Uncharacterized protein n=1 Tax=Pedobacter cryoconitis TaxID=188932 RepID=A0A7X0J4P4_9SPHI|nr:hypothetical protein [Pedobacter cryoconitis]MBB6500619.1 hypothetical protein [Pedobacter cryoconitis]